jgi:MoxR-like ATPase
LFSEALLKLNPSIQDILKVANSIIHGKDSQIRLILCSMIARGHILIEDSPGMGKTTLAKTLARLLGIKYSRIQFTNDLLPSDMIGSSIYREDERKFEFIPGPLFSELVLGDELNRASPRTQSACLQAMEEREITADGKTYRLPETFLFIATQNPRNSIGTAPIPDSQLDRFLMRISLGYPDQKAELKLLRESFDGSKKSRQVDELPALLLEGELSQLQKKADSIHVSEKILQYALRLVRESRANGSGLSPRSGLDLIRASKSWALIEGRDFVIPDDIQAVAPAVFGHRMESPEQLIQNVQVE